MICDLPGASSNRAVPGKGSLRLRGVAPAFYGAGALEDEIAGESRYDLDRWLDRIEGREVVHEGSVVRLDLGDSTSSAAFTQVKRLARKIYNENR